MILLLAQYNDTSSQIVIDWLDYFNAKYLLIVDKNLKYTIDNLIISNYNEGFTINCDDKLIKFSEIKSFWWRRGHLYNNSIQLSNTCSKAQFQLNRYLLDEQKKYYDFIYSQLNKLPIKLANFFKCDINKLNVLEIAVLVGLRIPETIITTKKKDVILFKEKHGRIISKSISEDFIYEGIEKNYVNYTVEVKKSDIEKLPNRFILTQFQEQISKRYELRIFLLKNTFFSMAIFSQQNNNFLVDCRNYDQNRPVSVPYKLPKLVERKLKLLCRKMNLDTGSIDMIVTEENDFVFLEINPDGQFGFVSSSCNYYLEKEIAKYLMNGK